MGNQKTPQWYFQINGIEEGPITSQTLKRSLKVWWRGTGAWIPIVSIVTLIVAHNRLIKNQKTSWDREGDFIIDHEKIGLLRVLLAIALFIIIYFAPVIMLRSFYF